MTYILRRPHTAADREGYEQALGGAPSDLEKRTPPFGTRGDIQKDNLVRTLVFVPRGEIDRIANITEFHELRALYDTAVFDVETHHNAPSQHLTTDRRAGGRRRLSY